MEYGRNQGNRTVGEEKKQQMLRELELEEALIEDPNLPSRFYNYRIQDQIQKDTMRRYLSSHHCQSKKGLLPSQTGEYDP